MRIIRVFPERNRATPSDPLVRVGCGPHFWDEADEVHISVTFTWHLPVAEQLEQRWRHVAPVKIGGPATGMRGEEFTPGMYIKQGYVITSRGCPNRCWFCSVWKREGATVRELPITQGWNVLDDNLLACSRGHQEQVFSMLREQKKISKRIEFTGGLEAARLTRWHAEQLRSLKPKQMFFAYDTPDDLEPLREAGKTLLSVGFTRESHSLGAYVLCGWPKDNFDAAEKRMRETIDAGFVPMAMLYRDKKGDVDLNWSRWQRTWANKTIVGTKLKGVTDASVSDLSGTGRNGSGAEADRQLCF